MSERDRQIVSVFEAEPREQSVKGLEYRYKTGSRMIETGNAVHDMEECIRGGGGISIMGASVNVGTDDPLNCFQVISTFDGSAQLDSELYSYEVVKDALDVLIAKTLDREEIDKRLEMLQPGEVIRIPVTITKQ